MSSNCALLALCVLSACHSVLGWQNPETVEHAVRIKLVNFSDWHQLQPSALKVTFDAALLIGKYVLTLHGYSERNYTRISKVKTPFSLLSTAPVPETTNGELDILSMDLKCIVKDDECNRYDMGYIEISPETRANQTATSFRSLYSQIIPLGWFLDKNFLKENFQDWAYGKCSTWYNSEANSTELLASLKKVSCPITMSVAMNDPGWFLKSNYIAGFSIEEWRTGVSTAQPAQTCFYSAIENVPQNLHAAPASICCYRRSDSMLLQKEFMSDEGINFHGSSALRSHPGGSDAHHEHYKQGQVPYLSHWYWDRLPFLYCCHWWKGSTCAEFYMKLRPAPRIMRKPAGSKAASVAESHVSQLDGQKAFCTEPGEYWLLRSPAVEIQMRNYVVSRYQGGFPLEDSFHRNKMGVARSSSAFVTGIAMRSLDTPHMVVELVCPEGEFRSYVQVTNTNSSTTALVDDPMSRGLGRNIVVGDVVHDKDTMSKKFSFLVKHNAGRVGVIAYVVDPGEELMNLYLTFSPDLLGSGVTGLINSGSCEDHKIDSADERIFSSVCDNCDDFEKYSKSRPPFYEELPDLNAVRLPPGITCNSGDTVCNYMAWSTQYPPYYEAVVKSNTVGIQPFESTLSHTDWDACQNPNTQVHGLYITHSQSLNESDSLKLKCMQPLSSPSEGTTVTCKKSGDTLAFDLPSDFKCAGAVTEEAKKVEVKQQEAKKANDEYTKKHYAPEEVASTGKLASTCGPPGPAIFISFVALIRLLRLL